MLSQDEEKKNNPSEDEIKKDEEVKAEEGNKAEETEPASEVDELTALKKEIENLKLIAKNEKDNALRTQAEMVNFRKRQEKERSNWNMLTTKDIISAMLDPFDNLERAIESASNKEDDLDQEKKLSGLIEGVQMVMTQLGEVLDRKNVKVVDPKGEKFNPNEHEAFGQIETDEFEEGHVAAVFRKGYKIGETLIRTATVQVAKAKKE